jgi:antitoxin component YwqK of YwqJK toxin-antitoxin module
MIELEYLEDKFNKISADSENYISAYSDSVKLNETKVVVSKGALYNLRPYEIERAGFKIGRKLNKLPTNVKNTHIYHFDILNRILLIEIFGQSDNIINKEFCIYESGNLERVYFTSAGMLRNISLSVYHNELVKKDFNWGMYGCSVSDYVYEGFILKKIDVKQKEHTESSFTEFEVLFSYKDESVDTITNVFPNGYKEQRYPAR